MAKKMTKAKTSGPAYKSPEYMKLLGQKRWKKTTKAARKQYASKIAKRSHVVNNSDAKRDGYHGGRRPAEES